jgi:hypothetical protein
LRRVVWKKFTGVSEVLAASIIRAIITLIMKAASVSETSVNFYQAAWCTRRQPYSYSPP